MNISRDNLETLFDDFTRLKVLIAGDVMIDSYLWGRVDRISPEAPVPVVLVNRRTNMLGGAANVALNIKALGAEPILLSVIGDDVKGSDFLELLEKDNISTEGIIRSSSRITTTKFRIIGNKSQLLRVDEEIDTDLNEAEQMAILDKIEYLFETNKPDVIIIQDYNKGVLTESTINALISFGRGFGIPVVVDPKKKNFSCYKMIDLFKPNLKELREGLKVDLDVKDIPALQKACEEWQDRQRIKGMMVTLSENGVYYRQLVDDHFEEHHIPAHVRNIADVSGAGDTVISVASLCRALKQDTWLTAALSNMAGGLVCEQVGVVPVNGRQLLREAIELFSAGTQVGSKEFS